LEESGIENVGLIAGEDRPAADTPDVVPPAVGVETVKREPMQKTLWKELPDLLQIRLEEGPCLARLAQSTARLGDFEAISGTPMAREGLKGLAEVIWGSKDVNLLLNSSDIKDSDAQDELRKRILMWCGMPVHSDRENVARSWIMLRERLMNHKQYPAIRSLLGGSNTASVEDMAAFLTTPYKATFEAIR